MSESERKKKVVRDCTADIMGALLALEAAAELMAKGTSVAADVFILGRVAGYIGAARSLAEVAEKNMLRVLDYQALPQSAEPDPN